MKRFIRSFHHASRGIRYALLGRNFRIQLILAGLAVFFGAFLQISETDMLILILACGLVLCLEATNTAVEEICNKFHPEEHPHIALIKDLAAGAVLIASIAAAIIGALIFLPHIW